MPPAGSGTATQARRRPGPDTCTPVRDTQGRSIDVRQLKLGGRTVLDDRDRHRYHEEARALLPRGAWSADDVDYAVWLHDVLEAPETSPDAVAKRLRGRLTEALSRQLAAA